MGQCAPLGECWSPEAKPRAAEVPPATAAREPPGAAGALELPGAPPGVEPMDVEIHISGLSTRQPFSPSVQQATKALRRSFDEETAHLVKKHRLWCTDATLVRFLIARDWKLEATRSMLREALRWREKRQPDFVLHDPDAPMAKRMAHEAQTGKLQFTGNDRYGRSVLILNNSVENTRGPDGQMLYLAHVMTVARRNMAPGVDKIVVVLYSDRFSVFNTPPMSVIKETLTILQAAFPETLGCALFFQPSAAFAAFFRMASKLLDNKTRSKIQFITGDCSPGTANDTKLQYLLGEDWRQLARWGQPALERRYSEYFCREINSSPGFRFEHYWADIIRRERAFAAAHPELVNFKAMTLDSGAWAKPCGKGPGAGGKGLSAGGSSCGALSVALAGLSLLMLGSTAVLPALASWDFGPV